MPLPLRLPAAPRALSSAAATWFVSATLGQWAFVTFIALFFGGHGLTGNFSALNDKPHITGYVPGDSLGNSQFLLHALLGGLVTFAGAWQLLPSLRRHLPTAHRWNGRLFLTVAFVTTLMGFYLTWVRGSQLGAGSNLSISLNGLLILVFSGLAWRSAWRKDIASHRRQALRAYLLVNGVWFLRIGIMLAGLLLSPLGIQIDYTGAVFVSVSFASWLMPLTTLELYFHAERSPKPAVKYAVAVLLYFLAVATLAGGVAAGLFMWLPLL
jgi:hypothetical protein